MPKDEKEKDGSIKVKKTDADRKKKISILPVSPGQPKLNEIDESLRHAKSGKPNAPLVRRLQDFASGSPDLLRDIPVDLGPVSDFRRRVYELCRRIPYGKKISYSELAAKACRPRAARAVGNSMAANKIPLIIPCHRVVGSHGKVGSYG